MAISKPPCKLYMKMQRGGIQYVWTFSESDLCVLHICMRATSVSVHNGAFHEAL